MKSSRYVRRTAVFAIMVASAALPAGVAHSAEGTAPSVTAKTTPVVDWVSPQTRAFTDDLGLPPKAVVAAPVTKAPSATPLTRDPVAPAPAAASPAAPAPAAAASPVKAKATTTNAKATTTKASTTSKAPAATAPQAPVAVAPAATQGSVTARQDLAAAVAAATNAQRTAAGLSPLAYRSCSVPASWAVHMASAGSLTHNSLTSVLSACGGTRTAGENIAAGYTSVGAVTAGWMGSAGHKANILNPSFKIISVGVAQAANGTYYWVEDFTG